MNNKLYTGNHYSEMEQISSKLVFGTHHNPIPLLTVAIPAYKRRETLKETLCCLLNQKGFDDYEIVITDDEVNDNPESTEVFATVKEINNPKIVLYHNEKNLGVVHNWNRCLFLSKSKYVCTLDDDDLVDSYYLSEMMGILQKHNEIDFLGAKWCYYNHEKKEPIVQPKSEKTGVFSSFVGKVEKRINGKLTRIDYLLSYPHIAFLLSGAIIKKDVAIKMGGFNPDWYPSMDYGFICEGALFCNTYVYNKLLCYSRLHENTSGKPDSVKRFCSSDYLIHDSLVSSFHLLSRWSVRVSNAQMIKTQLEGLNSFWGTNVTIKDVDELLPINLERELKCRAKKHLSHIYLKLLSLKKAKREIHNTIEI